MSSRKAAHGPVIGSDEKGTDESRSITNHVCGARAGGVRAGGGCVAELLLLLLLLLLPVAAVVVPESVLAAGARDGARGREAGSRPP